jgi:DNA polymerase III delta prime subunit
VTDRASLALQPVFDALARGLPGQSRALTVLGSIVANDALAHAYLFAGPAGAGKLRAAIALAVAADCTAGGCGTCDLCVGAAALASGARVHADVLVARPEAVDYPIDQVRSIRERLQLKPLELPIKFAILTDADRMRPAAANALLKVLEEPPDNTCIVLLTERYEAVLETIRSRCQLIEFKPLAVEDIVGALRAELAASGTEVPATDAKVAYYASGGRVAVARGLLEGRPMKTDKEKPTWAFAKARELVDTVIADLEHRDDDQLIQDAALFSDKYVDLLGEVASHISQAPFEAEDIEDMALDRRHSSRLKAFREAWEGRSAVSRTAAGAEVILNLFALAWRDLLCAAAGVEDLAVDRPGLARRVHVLKNAGAAGPIRALGAVRKARDRVRHNVSVRNAFLALLMEIPEVTRWRRRSA